MKVLILNGGSSSLKYHLFDMTTDTTMIEGNISNIQYSKSAQLKKTSSTLSDTG